MRLPLLLAAALLSLAASTAYAAPYSYAKDNGWHFKFSGAFVIPNDADVSINGGPFNFKADGDYDYETGFAFMTAIGYHWGGLRLEAEYGLRQTQSDKFNGTRNIGLTIPERTMDISINSFMLNLAYDINLTEQFYIYAGGGIGLAIVSLSHQELGVSSTELEFAYQAMAGIGYNLTESVALTLGYRIFTTTDTDFNDNGYRYDVDIPWMHHVELGVRYNF